MSAYVMVPPLRWLAISHSTIAALRLPAMKSTALPLACREGCQVPAMTAPGRHVDMTEDWWRDRGFRRLHLVAERSDIHLMSLRLVYMNGYYEDFPVDRLIREGQDQPIDLRGDRKYLQRIEMVYRSRPSFEGRAVMKVYGVPARFAKAFWTSGKLPTGSPSIVVMTSPGKSFPSAGFPGKTAPTVGGRNSRSSRYTDV